MTTDVDDDTDVVPNTLPYMTQGEFLTRLGAAQAHGFVIGPKSRHFITHTIDCPFVLLDEPEPCPACGNLLHLTNPGVIAFVKDDLVPHLHTVH